MSKAHAPIDGRTGPGPSPMPTRRTRGAPDEGPGTRCGCDWSVERDRSRARARGRQARGRGTGRPMRRRRPDSLPGCPAGRVVGDSSTASECSRVVSWPVELPTSKSTTPRQRRSPGCVRTLSSPTPDCDPAAPGGPRDPHDSAPSRIGRPLAPAGSTVIASQPSVRSRRHRATPRECCGRRRSPGPASRGWR